MEALCKSYGLTFRDLEPAVVEAAALPLLSIGFGIQGFWGLGFLGFRVWGLGFRVGV